MSKIEWTGELIKRVWSYVNIGSKSECWDWQKGLFSSGYGQFRIGNKKMRSHRLSYEIAHGSIPQGMCICHKCDNRKCVNPSHLFMGTTQQNTQDRHLKKRNATGKRHGAYTKPESRLPGSRNGQAKLTVEQVREIRRLRKRGYSFSQLSGNFDISKSQISNIIRNKSWVVGVAYVAD